MSKDFNSSNTVSVEVEVEVGDLVAWDWIVIPNGKNYALGQVGISERGGRHDSNRLDFGKTPLE